MTSGYTCNNWLAARRSLWDSAADPARRGIQVLQTAQTGFLQRPWAHCHSGAKHTWDRHVYVIILGRHIGSGVIREGCLRVWLRSNNGWALDRTFNPSFRSGGTYIIPILRSLRQEDPKFEASKGYKWESHLEKTLQNNQIRKETGVSHFTPAGSTHRQQDILRPCYSDKCLVFWDSTNSYWPFCAHERTTPWIQTDSASWQTVCFPVALAFNGRRGFLFCFSTWFTMVSK